MSASGIAVFVCELKCLNLIREIFFRESFENWLPPKVVERLMQMQGARFKEETEMSHRAMSAVVVITLFAALALALPMAARNDTANATRQIVKTNLDLLNTASLGGATLKAGTYTVSADGSKVTFSERGKTVAEAPIQWKDEQGKARFSTVVTDSGQIKEIHFSGKSQYIVVSQ
jgi:hypothetical protein